MSFKLDITGYDELIKALDRIEATLSGNVKQQMVQAAAEVVARRARRLCPRSTQTGSSRGWSNAYFAKRASSKPLADTISVEVRDYGQRALGVVGPEYPAGSLAHLVEFGSEGVYNRVMWGRRTDTPAKPQSFMRRAFDETQAEQLAAMEAVAAGAMRGLGL